MIPFRDVTGITRTCKKCSDTKDLKEGFRHSKRFDCYENTCKVCRSNQERAKRKSEPVPEKPLHITHKTCLDCNENKTIDNFLFHKGCGYYTNYCTDCRNVRRRLSHSKLNKEQRAAKNNKRSERYYRNISDRAHITYGHCVTFDKRKNLQCDVDVEYIKESLEKPCTYCGFPSTGLDRLTNAVGHTKENCIPCCRDCNVARSNHFTVEEMKVIGEAIREVKLAREVDNKQILNDYFHKGH